MKEKEKGGKGRDRKESLAEKDERGILG